ncbi:MAG TPA: hypothetical protein PKD53_27805 [Chloroflexaceae bacterium]|nr:hypothetical protein [Chloroflexaceae bacterium]
MPHLVVVKAPGEPRTVAVGGMTDSLPVTSSEAGYLMANLRAGRRLAWQGCSTSSS